MKGGQLFFHDPLQLIKLDILIDILFQELTYVLIDII